MNKEAFVDFLVDKYPNEVNYYDEIYDFYSPYLQAEELIKYVCDIINYGNVPEVGNRARLIMNNTIRLVNLAKDIDIIRPGKDGLRITFIISCIDTIYGIANIENKKMQKISLVLDFFDKHVHMIDRNLILSKVKRSMGCEYFEPGQSLEISMEIFARMINEVRNDMIHEGDYWGFSFSRDGFPIMQTMKFKESLESPKLSKTFDLTLTFEEFSDAMIRGFISFNQKFVSGKLKLP